MALITLSNLHLAYGLTPLLDGVNFTLESGERVCLIGRNGEGKSSLFNVILGNIVPDDGAVFVQDGIRLATMSQEVPQANMSVLECVMAGDTPKKCALDAYAKAQYACEAGDMDACMRSAELWQVADELHAFDYERQSLAVIDQLGLTGTDLVADLSGGRKRRVMLAQALASNPDVLLLDEPTNHLDIQSILWLQDFLKNTAITLLFITHDRQFVDALATSIIELDRGHLSRYDISQGQGGYARYLELKAQELHAEEVGNALFDKKLAQEEAWIRQGIKARRTRNEGRVRALKALRQARAQRRDKVGNVALTQTQADKSGKLVCQIEHLTLGYDESSPLIKDFSAVLQAGDKVGILGANGVGKSTLIHAILGTNLETILSGKVTLGTKLVPAFIDQLRDNLDESATILDNVAQGRDFVTVGGKEVHIFSYLQDFLFLPQRARTPVLALSGGEKARVLLAKQLLKPANLLVLDEPTNDLDMPTLELLEAFLVEFTGTVLLISHDRAFLDNVATDIWHLHDTKVDTYVGGYTDFLAQKTNAETPTKRPPKIDNASDKPKEALPSPNASTKKKLSYKESQELAALPAHIEALEREQGEIEDTLSDGRLFAEDMHRASVLSARLNEIEDALMTALERWEVLDG